MQGLHARGGKGAPAKERSASQQGALAVCPGYRPQAAGKRAHWVTEQGNRGHAALDDPP